ncbi:MAG TPA: hypothetical protein VGP80_15655 [Gemmatimonadales bacterium]|nr:hypothetical protein [Gemmatimonadales bacterium]
MRILNITTLITIALATTVSAQQVRLGARLGATWSSTLMKDVVVSPISVKAGIAPTLALSASIPSGRKYRLGLETVFTTASVKATENGVDTDLGSLRTATILLAAEGPLMVRDFYFRIGVGLMKYLPSEKTGIFQQGGPTRITGNFTAEYRKDLHPGWEWVAAARYGLSSFTTKELQSRGFTRSQAIHRVGLEVGVVKDF